jgi:hypothetical protein
MIHLELFSGTKSFSKISSELGYNVISVDISNKYSPTIQCNLLDFQYQEIKWVDLITASPPCNSFSQIGVNVHKQRDPFSMRPLKSSASLGDSLLFKTIEIIQYFLLINPQLKFVIENPHGFMWKMPILQFIPRTKTYYSMYESQYEKPTDFFHNLSQLILKNNETPGFKERKNRKNRKRIGYDYTSLSDRYKIPSLLIRDIFSQIQENSSIAIHFV